MGYIGYGLWVVHYGEGYMGLWVCGFVGLWAMRYGLWVMDYSFGVCGFVGL
jgi:hypothetical protein